MVTKSLSREGKEKIRTGEPKEENYYFETLPDRNRETTSSRDRKTCTGKMKGTRGREKRT